MLLFSLFLIVSTSEVKAISIGDATWSSYNAYSTYFYAIATIEVPYNTGDVQYQLPYSDYHEYTYGGLDNYIKFYYEDDLINPALTLSLQDVKGGDIEGIYSINLIEYNMLGVAEIEFWIPQNYSLVPGDYVTEGGFLDQRDYLIFVPVAPYEIPVFWNNINVYSTYYVIEAELDVPFNASSIQIYIPESAYHRFSYGGIDSTVIFYDEDDVILESVNLIDIADKPDGLMLIDFTSYQINEVAKIKIRIAQTYGAMPSGYTDYMSEFTSITYNADVKLVIYIVDNEEYDRKLFTSKPEDITLVKEDYTFDGWYFRNGVKYDFGSPIAEQYLEFNTTVILYARFSRTEILPEFVEGTPANAINSFLAIFHLNNRIGFIIFFIACNIVVVLGIKALKLPGTIMAIGMIGVTAFFIYVNLLPLLLIIMAIGVDIVALLHGLSRSE